MCILYKSANSQYWWIALWIASNAVGNWQPGKMEVEGSKDNFIFGVYPRVGGASSVKTALAACGKCDATVGESVRRYGADAAVGDSAACYGQGRAASRTDGERGYYSAERKAKRF
jgi:hypothetical protein